MNLAAKKVKEQPVIFYGKTSVYKTCKAWPKEKSIIQVAEKLKSDPQKFFEELQEAKSGFYFLEADDERDLSYTRGVDYHNSQPKGICLMLACTFANKSQYLQALGRVKRCTDQGVIYALQ